MKRHWRMFTLDAYIILNSLENWLESLTQWMDHPGPSCDDLEMQPDVTP